MTNDIERYKYRGYIIKIVYDLDAGSNSPASWGNYDIVMKPSINVVNEGHYNWESLVDEGGTTSNNLKIMLHNKEAWPIRYSSHGPQCLYELASDTDGADGYIIFSPEYMKNAGSGGPSLKQMAAQDLETYSDWANGSVYGFQIVNQYGTEFDGCDLYGIYGFDYAKREAEMMVDADINYDRPAMHAKSARELHR